MLVDESVITEGVGCVGHDIESPGGRKDRGSGDQEQSRSMRQSGAIRNLDLSLEGPSAKEPRGSAHYENKRASIPCARKVSSVDAFIRGSRDHRIDRCTRTTSIS